MAENRIEALVTQLLTLRDGDKIEAFRRQLDPETARAVIMHPRITPERRAAISLAKTFTGNPYRHSPSRITVDENHSTPSK